MECNKVVETSSIYFVAKNVINNKNAYVLLNDQLAPRGRSFYLIYKSQRHERALRANES